MFPLIYLDYRVLYNVRFSDDENAVQTIESMPGISRFGVNKLKDHLSPLVEKGLQSVLLFGVINNVPKVCIRSSRMKEMVSS